MQVAMAGMVQDAPRLKRNIMTAPGQREVLEEFGRRIVRLREAKGWTRSALARRLRVTRQRLGNWERGENTPPLGILAALKRELGVSIDELVTGEAAPANGFCRERKDQALRLLSALIRLMK